MISCFLSCKDENVFKQNGVFSKNTKLFIFPYSFESLTIDECNKTIKEGVLIENVEIINDIFTTWKGQIHDGSFIPGYRLQIVKNNILYASATLNDCLTEIQTSQGVFSFSPNNLLKYKNYFKPLVGLNIQVEDIDECRKLKNIISNQAYVLLEGIDSVFLWEKYSGTVKIKKEGFKNFPGLDVDSLIKEELKSNKKFEITNWENNESEGSIIVELLSDSTIYIPKGYSLLQKFKEFKNISFDVIGIDKEKITRIAKANNIKIKSIKKITF